MLCSSVGNWHLAIGRLQKGASRGALGRRRRDPQARLIRNPDCLWITIIGPIRVGKEGNGVGKMLEDVEKDAITFKISTW